MTDLNSLARRLLRENLRLDTHDPQDTVIYIGKFLAGGCSPTEAEKYSEQIIEELEPVIREAIDKTIDVAINRIKSIDCTDEDYWAGVTAAIGKVESLKQSNSGMEVRK